MHYSVIYPQNSRFLSLSTAMCPPMTPQAGSYQSRGRVMGGPIQARQAPGPGVEQSRAGQALMGTSRSQNAPDYIMPSQYWEGDMSEAAPVAILSDNQIPVPAQRAGNLLFADPFQVRIGGDRQIFQPQVVPVWYGLQGTAYG